jgi:4a-hydroxytetrahydrobiopterin dehydratase
VPTLLDEHLLRDSLGALVGWSGTTDRLERTVTLPADQDAELRARVQEASDSLDHHAVIDSSGEGTRFALWTHSEGGVTELDIALASRISDLLRQVTGDPKPIGRPRQDGVAVTAGGVPLPGEGDDALLDTPTIGVPAGSGGTPQVPLPDAEPGGPEPGATPEQEPGPLTGR